MEKITLGKFDKLAKAYKSSRPNYSNETINLLKLFLNKNKDISSLDLGCGTGIFTRKLSTISKKVIGVDMSYEMIKNANKNKKITYHNKKVENMKLNQKFDIISSASSFHWFDNKKISKIINFHLKDKGFFLIIYNTRNISSNNFLKKVEKKIISLNSNFKKRKSSGSSKFVSNKIAQFKRISKLSGPIKLDINHEEFFTKKRYFNVWKSANEFRNRIGIKNYDKFFDWLNNSFPKKGLKAHYINKCWIFQK